MALGIDGLVFAFLDGGGSDAGGGGGGGGTTIDL